MPAKRALIGTRTVASKDRATSIVGGVAVRVKGLPFPLRWKECCRSAVMPMPVWPWRSRSPQLVAAGSTTADALADIEGGAESSINMAIRAHCSFGYDPGGAAIATDWRLPTPLVDAIREQDTTDDFDRLAPVSRLVFGAVQLSHALSVEQQLFNADTASVDWNRQQWPDADRVCAELCTTAEDTAQVAAALFVQ